MKKFAFILLFVLIVLPVFADRQVVEMERKDIPSGRSIPAIPKVWFDDSIMELSVSFTSDTPAYEILVQDANGTVICQFTCSSNGVLHQFFIPDVPSDDYAIVISTEKHSYVGDLIID